LRVGIASGRLRASILVVPPRKLSLVEAFHRGWPWPSLSSINDGMASSRERKGREGEWRGGRALLTVEEEGGAQGVGGEAAPVGLGPAVSCCIVLTLQREEEKKKREKRKRRKERERRRGRKKKRKKMQKIFQN
jgi:hypothetical protein